MPFGMMAAQQRAMHQAERAQYDMMRGAGLAGLDGFGRREVGSAAPPAKDTPILKELQNEVDEWLKDTV